MIHVKPITNKKTMLSQAFDEFYKESLPIHYFERNNARTRKNLDF